MWCVITQQKNSRNTDIRFKRVGGNNSSNAFLIILLHREESVPRTFGFEFKIFWSEKAGRACENMATV